MVCYNLKQANANTTKHTQFQRNPKIPIEVRDQKYVE